MSASSGIASYTSSAALVDLIQGAVGEHGGSLGANTATLISLALGALVHFGVEYFKTRQESSGETTVTTSASTTVVPSPQVVSVPVPTVTVQPAPAPAPTLYIQPTAQ